MRFDQGQIRQPGESWFAAGQRWLQPRGGGILDGIRLAVLNALLLGIVLIGGIIIGIMVDLLRHLLPIPGPVPAAVVIVVGIAIGAFIWYRFGMEHEDQAVASGRPADPTLVGVIGALPMLMLAGFMAIASLIRLFVALVTLSGKGVSGSLVQLGTATMLVIAGVIVVAAVRAGSRA